MAKRKTIEVEALVNMVNGMLKDSAADAVDVRQGVKNLLEHVLHITGNYKGFRYLLKEEIPNGQPGIHYLDGQPHPNPTVRFAETDRTRVQYL